MMTKEQIQERIDKKQKDIEKILKRIAKWTSGMNPEAITVCANCELVYGDVRFNDAYKAYKEYETSHYDDPTVYRQDHEWNKGPQLNETYRAYRDLAEARATLSKYQVQMDKLINFDKEEKIEVIWKFLMNWKELSREWYRKNAKRYYDLKLGYKAAKDAYVAEHANERGRLDWYQEKSFEENYWWGIDMVTKEITKLKHKYVYPNPENRWDYEYVLDSYEIDEELLEKILDDEVKAKYKNLINQITHITGEITDALGLRIGAKGDINGIVEGLNGKASVQTFSAGGWNIQCFHYRTKVTSVK